MSDQNKVVKFKKRKSINIGIVVFLILFIYIAINVYIFLTKEQLTLYEVHEGTTAIDNRITALILRQETVVNSEKAGFVLYYQKDGARVAKNESIYSITDTGVYNITGKNTPAIELSVKNDTQLRHEVRTFQNSFSDNDFSSVYQFKEVAQNTILDMLNNSLISDISDNNSESGVDTSDQTGMITYYTDNFETVTSDQVTMSMFRKEKYKKTNLRTTQKISKNTPVYKMISSDIWQLVLPLTKNQYNKLFDKKKVTVTVLEDNYGILANLELLTKGSDYYGVLTLSKDMANYLGERFLEVSLDFNSVQGLKIPNTAIVDKDFYEVPMKYFTQGGESKQSGLTQLVYKENGDTENRFVPTDIYYKDEANKLYYIDTNLFEPGAQIMLPEASDTYTLNKTIKLSGVYNVNLGYAVFRRIEVLSKGLEYSIISDHTPYGLSAYDHIVLDGKLAKEQNIID